MRIVERPSPQEALEGVQEALRKGYVLVLAGRCSVNYSGRASSRLGLGDRVVIYKPDGSLLVHRPAGYEPVNWMPAGSYLTALNEEGLCLRALRRKPFEELKVTFEQVYFAAAGLLIDEEEFFLYATEEEMKRAVELRPSLIEPGFKLYSREKRLQLT
ncbi:MAG: endonuclease NucS, partial [Thermoprotei archaeon]